MLKTRFQSVYGLLGKDAGWNLDSMPAADFGNIVFAGANTARAMLTTFPLVNPSHIIKSPDNEPFEDPGGVLTAALGDRQVGSGRNPVGLILGAYLVRITAAGAVYTPAGSTINIRVVNAVTTVAGAFTTVGTFNAAAGTNFVETIPLVATTGRTFSPEGLPNAAAIALFNGDTVFAELVTTGALNTQTNLLAVVLEIA